MELPAAISSAIEQLRAMEFTVVRNPPSSTKAGSIRSQPSGAEVDGNHNVSFRRCRGSLQRLFALAAATTSSSPP
jgi:hypothetical protein